MNELWWSQLVDGNNVYHQWVCNIMFVLYWWRYGSRGSGFMQMDKIFSIIQVSCKWHILCNRVSQFLTLILPWSWIKHDQYVQWNPPHKANVFLNHLIYFPCNKCHFDFMTLITYWSPPHPQVDLFFTCCIHKRSLQMVWIQVAGACTHV